MRASRTLLAALALALLTACAADPTEMTAPSDASFDGGGWTGSGNLTDDGDGIGMAGSGNRTDSTAVSVAGVGMAGSGN